MSLSAADTITIVQIRAPWGSSICSSSLSARVHDAAPHKQPRAAAVNRRLSIPVINTRAGHFCPAPECSPERSLGRLSGAAQEAGGLVDRFGEAETPDGHSWRKRR